MPRIPYKIVEKNLSQARLSRYLLLSNGNKAKTIKLYKANLQVSRSFYSLLSVLEIVVRNNINETLILYFNDSDWIINQQTGFMSDNSLRRGNFYVKTEVSRAIHKIRQTGARVSNGKIVAEQTFGFWTSLLEPYNFRLIQGTLLNAFPNRPHGYGRNDILKELKKIQKFRNRIYHNEPVCFANNQIDFSAAIDVHNAILEIISWIDVNFVSWVKNLDSVLEEIRIAQQI